MRMSWAVRGVFPVSAFAVLKFLMALAEVTVEEKMQGQIDIKAEQ